MVFNLKSQFYSANFSIFLQMNPKVIERKMDLNSEKNIDEDESNLQNTAFQVYHWINWTCVFWK